MIIISCSKSLGLFYEGIIPAYKGMMSRVPEPVGQGTVKLINQGVCPTFVEIQSARRDVNYRKLCFDLLQYMENHDMIHPLCGSDSFTLSATYPYQRELGFEIKLGTMRRGGLSPMISAIFDKTV